MLFWFCVLSAISLFLTPSFWQATGENRATLINWQVVKIALAGIVAFFIGYVGLKDQTISAVFSTIPILYGVLLFGDIVILSNHNGKANTSIMVTLGIVGVISLGFWVTMTFFYPLFIKQDLYYLVQAEEKTEKIQATNIEHIPSVPIESAHYKGEKLIGQLANSSYYQLGELTRQKIDGEEVWIAPIEYQGYWEASKAGSIPGYVKVSAERKDDIGELVDKYEMKYVPSAYFGDNLERLVRSQFPQDIIIGGGFEPDDEGKPYYVIAVGHYGKYRAGTTVDGAVLVDPQTGNMKKYDIKDVPDFVDFVIPPNLASAYNEWLASYKHGWLNTWMGRQDISEVRMWNTGEEVIGVFGPDKQMYWFTDHSSPGTNSLKGYTLMNGRTGKLTYYKGSNGFANGKAALQAVHNSFKKEQWTGTNPILYNIYGTDTWFVPVIDANGLLRSIALVNAQNPQIVATGESKQEALNMYKFKLATEGTQEGDTPTDSSAIKEMSGKVLRVGSMQIGETTVIQILLDNSEKVFNINPKESTYATFIREGDQLNMSFIDTNEAVVSVEKVHNETLKR
ncbi:hypothetical protein ACFVS2_26095 [Brevibacillus sp. NPDC058079]|uniref:hypothetical protein n=1 Tax=Brevibacillus sp. NPDC058079 TaxID=3346330 RepID=UPI0036E18CF6